MEELKVIGWVIWMFVAVVVVQVFVGQRTVSEIRAWMIPAHLGALAFFSAAAICNPWAWS